MAKNYTWLMLPALAGAFLFLAKASPASKQPGQPTKPVRPSPGEPNPNIPGTGEFKRTLVIGDSYAVGFGMYIKNSTKRGEQGTRANQWVSKVKTLIQPGDLVYLSVGTNDLAAGRPLSDIQKDIQAIADSAYHLGAVSVIYFVPPGTKDGKWTELANADWWPPGIISVHAPTTALSQYAPDKIHFTPEGYKEIARSLEAQSVGL